MAVVVVVAATVRSQLTTDIAPCSVQSLHDVARQPCRCLVWWGLPVQIISASVRSLSSRRFRVQEAVEAGNRARRPRAQQEAVSQTVRARRGFLQGCCYVRRCMSELIV